MRDVILYLITNPFLGVGLVLLALLIMYNVIRRQTRIAMGMWLLMVAVLFYIWVQVSNETDEFNKIELAAPPPGVSD
jgi:hypothetical protein